MRLSLLPFRYGVLVVAGLSLLALPAAADWEEVYSVGGNLHSQPLDACSGHGFGLVICGGTFSQGLTTDGSAFVMKLDQAEPLEPVFTTVFDPYHNGAVANGICNLNDGTYVIAGAANTFSKSPHPLLAVIDDDGNVLESHELTELTGRGRDVFMAADGGYILSGETWAGDVARQCFVSRISPDLCTIEWTWLYSEQNPYPPRNPIESRIYTDCVLEIPGSFGDPYGGKIIVGLCTDPGDDYPTPDIANAVVAVLDGSGNELVREHWALPCALDGT
ncbi:MAG: hypothetical protein R6U36_08040 [Candidatus Fermentibacteraceae bacterium]